MIIFFIIFILEIGIDPIDHVEILTVERIHSIVLQIYDIVCGRNGAEDIAHTHPSLHTHTHTQIPQN